MPSRRPSRQLTQLFEQSPLPVYVVDESRRIVYCNAACASWLGIEAIDLVGRTCEYHAGDGGTALAEAAAALCPPPQAFLDPRTQGQVIWRNAEGAAEQRPATFLLLPGPDREAGSVVAILGEPQPTVAQLLTPDEVESEALHTRLQQLARQQRTRFKLDRLVGDSPAIRRVREQVRVAIASRSRVLIVGPPGSGREHVARTIHTGDISEPAIPLLPVACSTVDAELLQSTILGFLRRCQDQGVKFTPTLLLLDVDQLSQGAQAELLSFFRVPTFAMRTIATSRIPLLPSGDGRFQAELAFILSTLVIELPPLAQRREDIPLLAQRFVEEFNAAGTKQLAGLSPAAIDRLASLPWVGDVEELAGVVQEACRAVGTVWIGEGDLPSRVRSIVAAGAHPRRPPETIQLDEFLLEVERELIQRAMSRARGNKAKAARLLGVSRARLFRRLTQLGLETPTPVEIEFKPLDDAPGEEGASEISV